MEIHEFFDKNKLFTGTFGQQPSILVSPVGVEVINGVNQDIEDEIEQFLDIPQLKLKLFRLPINPLLFVLDRATHHKDLQRGLFLLQRLNLFLIQVDIPVEVLHLPDQKFITFDGLEDSVGLPELVLENVVDQPEGLVVVAD